MSDFLQEMADVSLARARSSVEKASVTGLESRARSAPPPVELDLSTRGFDVIAEVKLASPSEGRMVDEGDDRVVPLAMAYAGSGAIAVSVLTEETRFGGSLRHLEAVADAVDVPVMRKDFLTDPLQVLEARAAGASGVLLIARMLPGGLLAEMTDKTLDLGMFALVEVFDGADLELAESVFDRKVLVGVNCRDLATLEVDRSRLGDLASHLPEHLPSVAESGMVTPGDVATVAAIGYRGALIGSSLVTDGDPAAKLRRFIDAGRDSELGMSG